MKDTLLGGGDSYCCFRDGNGQSACLEADYKLPEIEPTQTG